MEGAKTQVRTCFFNVVSNGRVVVVHPIVDERPMTNDECECAMPRLPDTKDRLPAWASIVRALAPYLTLLVCHGAQLLMGNAVFIGRFIDVDEQDVFFLRGIAENEFLDLIWRAILVKHPRGYWQVELATCFLVEAFAGSGAITSLTVFAYSIEELASAASQVYIIGKVTIGFCYLSPASWTRDS